MGSQESKVEQPPCVEESPKEADLGDSATSSPISTPVDPRSPSANIARTPLNTILASEAVGAPIGDENVNDFEAENVVLGIDPRSPTVEFNRTPIIVATLAKDPTRPKNKNLENVLKSEIQTTPVATLRKSSFIPPKLLESSPVSIISNYTNKRKSFVGLLETNIDFTETDLDTVPRSKEAVNKSLPVEEVLEDLQIDTESKISPEVQNEKEPNDQALTEKVINITAQVKDFDKKLTNLIYEDNDVNLVSPRSTKIKENNRTPLGIRNSNDDSKKKNRLKVSDKPRKLEISRIPILKDHCRRVQCENTPPMKMDESLKKKVSQWDADKTLII